MADEDYERKFFSAFDKYDVFVPAQKQFLELSSIANPSAEEKTEHNALFLKLSQILNEYQEQSYLLDPHLEELVTPVVEYLKLHVKNFASDLKPQGIMWHVPMLLYSYIKCRGYKTIIRYFPHEIADLLVVVTYMRSPESPVHEPMQWALRYVILLWLSLICMIPFDLSQFDEGGTGQTASSIESIGRQHLPKAGLEREGAALLLTRFYMRQDSLSRFTQFLEWSTVSLDASGIDLFTCIGILHVLCEIAKSGPLALVQSKVSDLLSISTMLEKEEAVIGNTIVRKLQTKLNARIALRLLPGKSNARVKGPSLSSGQNISEIADVEDIDIPEGVETVLEQLFSALQDKDTLVRWSAAKGIARVAERLPVDFVDQVLETVLGHFKIHSVTAATMYDVPAIAEATWHGACLACAEMMRRGLVSPLRLPELIEWLARALYFDVRKGAHSVGSNVRDSGAYVLWAMARAHQPSDLAQYADDLARHLVTVSLYDREVHIRRAASAAFQEFVGRTSLFPHGIDVLRKTDFYAVGIRRNAFLIAAPEVAEHIEYRPYLLDHLLNVTLRHWDINMRRLGSQSLRLICMPKISELAPDAISRCVQLLHSPDLSDIHGGILGLAEIAVAFQEKESSDVVKTRKREIFSYLNLVPESVLLGPRNEMVTAAACEFLTNTVTLEDLETGEKGAVPNWRKIMEFGLKHKTESVQEAAASTIAVITKLVDCNDLVLRLTLELKRGSLAAQQCLGRMLGVVDYNSFPACLQPSVKTLLGCIDRASGAFRSNVEARRNCFIAMPQILNNISVNISRYLAPTTVVSMFDALLDGLSDYTIDERGDVGSWIRIACIQGLTSFIETMIGNAANLSNFEQYLPSERYHEAIKGILKQGVERLDNVRQVAGERLCRILRLSPPAYVPNSGNWVMLESDFFGRLFLVDDASGWNDAAWLFPKAVRILEVEGYRKSVLLGLIASVASLTDSTHRPVATSLVAFASSLPLHKAASSRYSLLDIVDELLQHMRTNTTANSVVVPVLQVFNVLFEGDALRLLQDDEEGTDRLQTLLSTVSGHVERIKNIRRIQESMKILVNLLAFEKVYSHCIEALPKFLGHQYPVIRTDTSERLYLALQSMEFEVNTEEAEEVLLQTEWSSTNIQVATEAAQQVANLLKEER
ncbi:ARM repeat-containing protein [Dendrothele bispora CBS 962.96]|uniref:ARM repeat-containing protein n=1 Tax=Dendrothele bispora (strain CBS 962.96) TaxID=1314807 RepID=A0A4S8MR52_DENBC|nr:ARM repeat-containing protein [Dendrothele bispora CBS 962.96]